jgi:hypothetical protein
MSDTRVIEDKPPLPFPRVLQIIGSVKKGYFLAFADETGKTVVAMEATSSDEVAKAVQELKTLINNVGVNLKEHEDSKGNVHKLKVEELTETSPNSGSLRVVFSDDGYLSGDFRFDFDPYMYSSGNLNFTLNVGEYAPPPIANRTINYNGKIRLCENWDASNNGYPVFVTERMVGDSVYFYVSVINLGKTNSSARLFFLIGGGNDATSMSQVTPFGDAVASAVSLLEYEQSGSYQVLTEKVLRDKVSGKAFTICVEDGELKLQEYRMTKYE